MKLHFFSSFITRPTPENDVLIQIDAFNDTSTHYFRNTIKSTFANNTQDSYLAS